MVIALPKVQIGTKQYFVDDRLQEIRNVANPHDAMSYDKIDHFRDNVINLPITANERIRILKELELLTKVLTYNI